MRIGLFHTTLPSPNRKLGGVEVSVHRLANQLVQRGHDVEVTTVGAERPDGAEYATQHIGSPRLARSRALRFSLVPILLNKVDFSTRDVLSLHGDDWFFMHRTVPTIRTFYGSAWREAQSATRLRRKFFQTACFPAELLSSRLADGSYTACAGMPRGYRLDGVLPLAVGLTPEVDGVRSTPARSECPSVLFVGTWSGRKRGAWLRDVFMAEVLPRVPEATLWMVSDLCEENEHVRWIRFPSDAKLSELYSRAWVFCLPSTYEGFGLPYVEAMSHGTPVVASPNPGSRLLLRSGADGVLAADDALGTALGALLADSARRDVLAAAGLHRAQDFSWDRTCGAYERAFESAIERSGKHQR
jgi:phosphatidyl-myo-inositol alpha-mannosyltransferase